MGLPRLFRPWNSQPQEAAGVSEEALPGLAFLFNPGVGFADAISSRSVSTGGISISPCPDGRGFHAASSASVAADFGLSTLVSSNGAGTGDFTVLVRGDPIASGTREMLYYTGNGVGQDFYCLANANSSLSPTSGSMAFICPSTGNQGIAQAGIVDGKPHTWVYIRAGTTGTLYCDGALVGTTGVTQNTMWASNSHDYVGGSAATGFGMTNSVSLVAGWNRAIGQTQALRWSAQPLDLYEPQTFWVPGSTGGTLVSADLGTANASGFTANVSAGTTITATLATAVASGFSANIASGTTISANLGIAAATGLNAIVTEDTSVPTILSAAVASGFVATISSGQLIVATRGDAVASGFLAGIALGTSVNTLLGTAAAAGFLAGIDTGLVISASRGNAVADGFAATISQGITVNALLGTASADGFEATVATNGEITIPILPPYITVYFWKRTA